MAIPVFQVGDPVTIRTLKKSGIVVEQLGSGSYRVAVGSLIYKASQADLERAVAQKPKDQGGVVATTARRSSVASSLDLHGLTVAEAVSKLEIWLNDAIVSGHKQVKVIHGLGSGRVQQATHEALSRYPAVRAFRVNDANPGVTDVYIG
jgi:DNA mismatch repair protein MutS2